MSTREKMEHLADAALPKLRKVKVDEYTLSSVAKMFSAAILPNWDKGTWTERESAIAEMAERVGRALWWSGVFDTEAFNNWMQACGLDPR